MLIIQLLVSFNTFLSKLFFAQNQVEATIINFRVYNMSFELSAPVPLSDNSEAILEKEIGETVKIEGDLVEVYEINRTVDFIKSGNYNSVCFFFFLEKFIQLT